MLTVPPRLLKGTPVWKVVVAGLRTVTKPRLLKALTPPALPKLFAVVTMNAPPTWLLKAPLFRLMSPPLQVAVPLLFRARFRFLVLPLRVQFAPAGIMVVP